MFSRPKKLYKYLSANGAQRLFSTKNPTIWFRLPNQLNDVYDIRPVGSALDEFGAVPVFCLSENPCSAPMWAHYGTNGQGVLLEFSLNSPFFERYPPLKVRYRRKRPTVKDVPAALTVKSAEWSYEQEWRCLLPVSRSTQNEHTFLPSEQAFSVPFPFDALTAVIHGYDSTVSAGEFLKRPEAKHTREMVCRMMAWEYGFKICAVDDVSHLLANARAATWGRQQRQK